MIFKYKEIKIILEDKTADVTFPLFARFEENNIIYVYGFNEDGSGTKIQSDENRGTTGGIKISKIYDHVNPWDNLPFYQILENKTTKQQFQFWLKNAKKYLKEVKF